MNRSVDATLGSGYQDAHQAALVPVSEPAGSNVRAADEAVAEFDLAGEDDAAVQPTVQLKDDALAVQGMDKGRGRVHGRKPAARRGGADTGIDDRRRRLGKIHQGKKALGLSDPEYRALLMRASADEHGIGGIDSSANMTEAQHVAVLREMTRLGFKAADTADRKRSFPGRPKGQLSPMLRKVEALLTDSKRPWSYAHGIAKRMFNTVRVEWLNDQQMHSLVAAMQVDQRRQREKP